MGLDLGSGKSYPIFSFFGGNESMRIWGLNDTFERLFVNMGNVHQVAIFETGWLLSFVFGSFIHVLKDDLYVSIISY